ncbi:hypothetical protein LCGC14_0336140 [marine sediment metagenome]|uniref:Galactosyltransferase C-terminal domain-containing protein n=1 Tax=marine sediment metagenome TaxID=412755 RepID=A0A0F9TKJ4_9ZZZZ
MTNQRKIAVVFVAYGCVPQHRLDDHFKWNDAIYRESNATVLVVTDALYELMHPNGTQRILPKTSLPQLDGKVVFSLTKTKNFGVNYVLEYWTDVDVIICTDVDVAFSPAAWDIMCEVEHGQAIMPVYHLCRDFDNRHQEPSRVDYGMTGTTAMVAEHWREIQYDERCVGYGADDGILLRDIQRAGIQLIPPRRKFPIAPVVWHVDHTLAAVDNVPGGGRPDCWGRAEGFNPDNFEANRKLHDNR